VADAVDLLEYCNHPEGTMLSDLRRANGAKEPYDVRVWCLGNELDGPWQIGHKSAYEYGRLAAETARAMRRLDADLELVACGSSNTLMPTFATWEATVLQECYDAVDYVSLHNYYDPVGATPEDFLASAVDLDRAIDAVVATADHVGARVKSRRRLQVSVDEWNVWYQNSWDEVAHSRTDWVDTRRLIEDTYDVVDAAVVGSLLITLLRHADRVGIACQAQLVNVIAPIRTEPGGAAWRQTIFHPFAQTAALARGEVLRVDPVVECYDTALHGEVPLLEATATYDEEAGEVVLLAVNRSTTDDLRLSADVRGFPGLRVAGATTLTATDRSTTNSAAHPGAVHPTDNPRARLEDGRLDVVLPPVSWNVVRLVPDTTRPAPRTTSQEES
jgi:alpha-N-arabinofuranosidase